MSQPEGDYVLYSQWQEACRKDIERAFGVLQQKLHVITKIMETWDIPTMKNIMDTCITLHNMMVEHCVDNSETDNIGLYDELNVADIHSLPEQNDDQGVNLRDAAVTEASIRYHGSQCQHRWEQFASKTTHFILRDAICAELHHRQNRQQPQQRVEYNEQNIV
jgi:hypothetical protein